MQLGGTSFPTTIDNHGRYLFKRAVLRYNGNAEAVEAIFASVLWTFPYMDMADFEWLHDTLMEGDASKVFTSGSLKDDRGNLITITNAVAYRPTYEFASGGEANGVVFEIKRIRE